jgi:hypothetical protein
LVVVSSHNIDGYQTECPLSITWNLLKKIKSSIFFTFEYFQLWALSKWRPTLAPSHASRHASLAALGNNLTHPKKTLEVKGNIGSHDHVPCSQIQKNKSSSPLYRLIFTWKYLPLIFKDNY